MVQLLQLNRSVGCDLFGLAIACLMVQEHQNAFTKRCVDVDHFWRRPLSDQSLYPHGFQY